MVSSKICTNKSKMTLVSLVGVNRIFLSQCRTTFHTIKEFYFNQFHLNWLKKRCFKKKGNDDLNKQQHQIKTLNPDGSLFSITFSTVILEKVHFFHIIIIHNKTKQNKIFLTDLSMVSLCLSFLSLSNWVGFSIMKGMYPWILTGASSIHSVFQSIRSDLETPSNEFKSLEHLSLGIRLSVKSI